MKLYTFTELTCRPELYRGRVAGSSSGGRETGRCQCPGISFSLGRTSGTGLTSCLSSASPPVLAASRRTEWTQERSTGSSNPFRFVESKLWVRNRIINVVSASITLSDTLEIQRNWFASPPGPELCLFHHWRQVLTSLVWLSLCECLAWWSNCTQTVCCRHTGFECLKQGTALKEL